MTTSKPRREGGKTLLDIDFDTMSWILYARESNDMEEQVRAQLVLLRKYVRENGGVIGAEFLENNVSAFKKVRTRLHDGTYIYRVRRPDWEETLKLLRTGVHNALVIPNSDRGWRDPRDLEDLIDLVEQHGVYVQGVTGKLDLTTDEGIASARNEVQQRNQESRNTSRRTKGGKLRVALLGHNSGGANRPFGWRSDRKSLHKREVKHILREIPRLMRGLTLKELTLEWQERRVPTVTGASWSINSIRQIFTNPRLCGYRTFHGEILLDDDGQPVIGVWDRIISPEEFEALEAVLRPVRKHSKRGTTTSHLLSPFLRCGKCHKKLVGNRSHGDVDGEKIAVYQCRAKVHGGCGGITIKAEPVEAHIVALVKAEQSKLNLVRTVEPAPWAKEQELEETQKQINETTEAYKNKQITGPRYFPLLQSLEDTERTLKSERRQHNAEQERRVQRLNIASGWDSFSLAQKQAAIAKSISAIVIKPATRRGAKFALERISIVWNEDED